MPATTGNCTLKDAANAFLKPRGRKLHTSQKRTSRSYSVAIPHVTVGVCIKVCAILAWKNKIRTMKRTLSYCSTYTFSQDRVPTQTQKATHTDVDPLEGTCALTMALANPRRTASEFGVIKSIAFMLTPAYTCSPAASVEPLQSSSWPASYDACATACNIALTTCNGFSWIGYDQDAADAEDSSNTQGRCVLNTFIDDLALNFNALSCKKIIRPPSETTTMTINTSPTHRTVGASFATEGPAPTIKHLYDHITVPPRGG
jgi:hypothetical protein